MKSLKKLLGKISERPRLVFAVVMVFMTVICGVVFGVMGNSLMMRINCVVAWLAVAMWFGLSMKLSGYRMATILLPVVAVLVVVTLVFWGEEYSYLGLLVLPAVVFAAMVFDYSRLWSRKNLVLVVLIVFLALACVGIGLNVIIRFGIVPVIMSVFLIMLVFGIKSAAKFNGIHWGIKKYFKLEEVKRVSVVIPNYNYARYLRERVDSIIAQKYPIYELIILDDKSTDESVSVIKEIIEELKEKRPDLRVRFVPNEVNSGNVFKQWKKCFDESKGDFVWICEADDSCSKYFLNAAMRAFDDDEVVMSYTESCTIDANGKKQKRDLRDWIDMFGTGHWRRSYVLDGKEELKQVLCINNTIANVSSVVFRKKKILKKYLDEAKKFTLAGDWYFYSKVLLYGKIAYHEESLNYHRMHAAGVTLTTDNYKHYNEIIRVQDSIGKDVKLGREAKKKVALRRTSLEKSFGFSKDKLKYANVPLEKIIKRSKVKEEVLLSVVVCAYNAEKYIGDCLKSVMAGLPDKTEVIVIDDGSEDDTKGIVKEIAKTHAGLKYFHKSNGGLSSAKNRGLKEAVGRYVIFMDADDKIASDGYDTMLKKAIDTNADVVICDMELVYGDGKTEYCSVYHYGHNDKMIGFLVDGLMASSNNKMVKRKLFDGIKYPEGKNNEDVAVTPVILALSKNIQYIPSAFYKYYQRKGSIQNSDFNIKRLVIFDTCKLAIRNLKEVVPNKEAIVEGIIISNQLIALLVYVICDIKKISKRNKIIAEFCRRFKELGVEENDYIKKYNTMIGMPDLVNYIINKNPGQINAYVRRCKNKEVLVSYIRKILNIRKEQ